LANQRTLRPHIADSTGSEPTLFDDRFGHPAVTKKGKIGVSAPLARKSAPCSFLEVIDREPLNIFKPIQLFAYALALVMH
jgi:hypothetical protein